MAEHTGEIAEPCRFGTHAPRDCPARVFALRGTTPPACPDPSAPREADDA